MNYFKAAEEVLKSVPQLKQAKENLKKREKRIIESNAPRDLGAIDYSKPYIDSNSVNDTLNELLELSECRKNITENDGKLDEIYGIVKQLEDKEKKFIQLWYFEKNSKETIMEKMSVESLTTVYNLKNRAVAEFALRYYGGSALPSI